MAERITGHLRLIERKGGPVYYSRIRFADGRQSQKAIGPKWTGRGRPPAGHFTDKTAEEYLQTMLTDARRGTLEGSVAGSGKTFGDACAEWLRYSRDDKQLTASTMRDYRNSVRCHLLPEFGPELPIEAITTERIEVYRERLLEEGTLSRRSIQKLLVLLHGIMKRAKRRKKRPSVRKPNIDKAKALDMIVEGYLPTEIAREVGVTAHTVNKWKRQMVRKLYWEQQAA